MAVQFQNISGAPPDYDQIPPVETRPNEPLIMIPIRKEMKEVGQRQSRHQFVKRCACRLSMGLIYCVVAFLVGLFIWNHFGKPMTESVPVLQTSTVPPEQSENEDNSCQKRVVGYYDGWDNRKITEKQIKKLTHIIFDGIKLRANGKIEFAKNESQNLFMDMKNKARAIKSDVKVMFSTDTFYSNVEEVSPVMADSKLRRNWINSITSFILEQQLDGVELYYRWPETQEQKEDYVLFVRELRSKLEQIKRNVHRSVPHIISVYCRPFGWQDESETILNDLVEQADFLNIETHNYNGPWYYSGISGPLSPLYSIGNTKSIDGTLKTFTCRTMQPNRLNLIITFIGLIWKEVNSTANGGGVYRTVTPGDYSIFDWRVLQKFGLNFSEASWDDESKTPYIWDAEKHELWTFENEKSVREKVKYAVEKNVGGVTINAIDIDDEETTLLNAITSIDMCSGEKMKQNEIKYDCGGSSS